MVRIVGVGSVVVGRTIVERLTVGRVIGRPDENTETAVPVVVAPGN